MWNKGKGKSEGEKGKHKKGDKETRTCFICGKPGYLSTICWYKDSSTESGKGKHKDGKGKSKSDKNAAVSAVNNDETATIAKVTNFDDYGWDVRLRV
jgi:hypothetical protein